MTIATDATDPVDLLISKDIIYRILNATSPAVPPDEMKLAELEFKLKFISLTFVNAITNSSKTGRASLNRKIEPVVSGIQFLRSRLASDKYADIRKALEAASLDFNCVRLRERKPLLIAAQIFEEADEALSKLQHLIEYLFDRQKTFDELSDSAKNSWPTEAQSQTEHNARQVLYPYLSTGISPETEVIRNITQLYHWLFDRQFAVTSRLNKPGYQDGQVRYSGPGIRFACAVLTELHLVDHFGSITGDAASEADALANKVGDLWTNDKRRSRVKP
jgi:hypothetical protein